MSTAFEAYTFIETTSLCGSALSLPISHLRRICLPAICCQPSCRRVNSVKLLASRQNQDRLQTFWLRGPPLFVHRAMYRAVCYHEHPENKDSSVKALAGKDNCYPYLNQYMIIFGAFQLVFSQLPNMGEVRVSCKCACTWHHDIKPTHLGIQGSPIASPSCCFVCLFARQQMLHCKLLAGHGGCNNELYPRACRPSHWRHIPPTVSLPLAICA